MKDLENAIAESFKELKRLGWKAPIYFCFIGSNGTIMGGTLEDDIGGGFVPQFNAQYLADGKGITVPINIMYVRENSHEAVHLVLDQSGPIWSWD